MKIFLTGATGYIGSVVAEKLLNKGYEITGLARNEESEAKLREKGIEPLSGDLKDIESLKRGAKEADAVIHTAFIHDFGGYASAVETDRAATRAFAEVLGGTNKPFITTTGAAFLGDTGETVADENFPYDRNSPFFSRAEAEQDALALSQKGIRSIVLRLPLFVYGRAGSSFVPFLINQAREKGAANYIESGGKRVSAVHVEDAADLYVRALETSTAKGLYNVAAENVSFRDLSESVARLVGVKAKSITGEEAKTQFGALFDFLSISNQLDAGKAQRELGWKTSSGKTILDDIENGSYIKLRQ
ncbi:MAG TPA: SDR family oxidoreductase [Pyrinomonadaceae bacterium]|jgi:nucleoside-diphosphate-sugar epimerase